MLTRMSSLEYAGWEAMAKIQPFGERREDLRAGAIACSIIRHVLGAFGVSSELKPEDWIMEFETPKSKEEKEKDEATTLKFQRFVAQAIAEGDRIKELRRQDKWQRK